ncbi:uncharacterized protein LOC122026139 [Zingiber officinale]|uniref:Uncharacterized protein n=1 Tax=Zingiber officinale TaxID=94328 RepID=A0A8J5CXR0_ZINOF|nr:uncharacterized protein LOC122026139 [Zingiber officinale]KAG6474053.1 hypothetical protein ZIOFF_067977 [Zingiber officinale]
MGNHGEGDNPNCCCRFHPKQTIVGVCALCLRERLLVLAANSEQKSLKQSKSSAIIGKVFALPSFHLSHANNKFDDEAASASISSLEESFISIKFEENGHASWYSNRSIPSSTGLFIDCTKHRSSSRSMAEHSDETVPKWCDRIGQLAKYWKSKKKRPINKTCKNKQQCN